MTRSERHPWVVAVTGGMGSGKSTFCRLLAAHPSIVHLDADRVAHELLENDEVAREIQAAFGDSVRDAAGAIDRARLGALAFADPGRLERLERILHPRVLARLEEDLRALKREGAADIVIVEIPLLAESGVPSWCDYVIAVEAAEPVRIARSLKRGFDEGTIRRRLARQATSEQRRSLADLVVDNSGGLSDLGRKVEQLRQAWARSRPASRHGSKKSE
ncbi:MAG: dephospho-CoA kinase [Candidatus Eisenbacteria bacterium]|nr:dephospho-CoA kinase [Candidatus Eisenbacteria bacterium]